MSIHEAEKRAARVEGVLEELTAVARERSRRVTEVDEVTDRVKFWSLRAIEMGVPESKAARIGGVSVSTLRKWEGKR